MVIVWDNLNIHRTAGLHQGGADHDWLTIFQLPSYVTDLNLVEDVWSLLRRGPMANTAFTDPEHLERTFRRGLGHVQRHPDLINYCLTETGLHITAHPTPSVSSGPRPRPVTSARLVSMPSTARSASAAKRVPMPYRFSTPEPVLTSTTQAAPVPVQAVPISEG